MPSKRKAVNQNRKKNLSLTFKKRRKCRQTVKKMQPFLSESESSESESSSNDSEIRQKELAADIKSDTSTNLLKPINSRKEDCKDNFNCKTSVDESIAGPSHITNRRSTHDLETQKKLTSSGIKNKRKTYNLAIPRKELASHVKNDASINLLNTINCSREEDCNDSFVCKTSVEEIIAGPSHIVNRRSTYNVETSQDNFTSSGIENKRNTYDLNIPQEEFTSNINSDISTNMLKTANNSRVEDSSDTFTYKRSVEKSIAGPSHIANRRTTYDLETSQENLTFSCNENKRNTYDLKTKQKEFTADIKNGTTTNSKTGDISKREDCDSFNCKTSLKEIITGSSPIVTKKNTENPDMSQKKLTPSRIENRRTTYDLDFSINNLELLKKEHNRDQMSDLKLEEERFTSNKTVKQDETFELQKSAFQNSDVKVIPTNETKRGTFELEKSVNDLELLKKCCRTTNTEEDNSEILSVPEQLLLTDNKCDSTIHSPELNMQKSTINNNGSSNGTKLLRTSCNNFGTPIQDFESKKKYASSTPHPGKIFMYLDSSFEDSFSQSEDNVQKKNDTENQPFTIDDSVRESFFEQKRISSIARLKKRRSKSLSFEEPSLNEFLINEKVTRRNCDTNVTRRKRVTFKNALGAMDSLINESPIDSPKINAEIKSPKKPSKVTKKLSKSLPVFNDSKNQKPTCPSNAKNIKQSATKMPNFAQIHKNLFEKQEDIKQYKERKAERSKLLLSGHKPDNFKQEKVHNKENKPKKQLNFFSNIDKKETYKTEEPSKSGATNVSKQNKINTEQKKAFANKTKVERNGRAQRRDYIQGVRSNRRFDLLMKMRQKQT